MALGGIENRFYDLKSALQSAKSFANGNERYRTFLTTILTDPQFHKDPPKFLARWAQKKNSEDEEFDLIAFMFFKQYFQKN